MNNEFHSNVNAFDWLKVLMNEADKMEEKPPYYHLVESALRNGVVTTNEVNEILMYLVNDQISDLPTCEYCDPYGWNLKEEV